MQNRYANEIVESARQFASFGLNIASTAVGYAAQVLRDVEKGLRESGDRFKPGTDAPAANDTAARPPSA
jgi:hypothetical protein